MNDVLKITLAPLDFEEFNALDVLVNGEIAQLAYQARASEVNAELDRKRLMLLRLRSLRLKIDRARPPAYAAAIRAAAEVRSSVCET